jgi:hypothetical protein
LFFGGVDGSVWELIYRVIGLAALPLRWLFADESAPTGPYSPMNRLPQVPIRR